MIATVLLPSGQSVRLTLGDSDDAIESNQWKLANHSSPDRACTKQEKKRASKVPTLPPMIATVLLPTGQSVRLTLGDSDDAIESNQWKLANQTGEHACTKQDSPNDAAIVTSDIPKKSTHLNAVSGLMIGWVMTGLLLG